MVEHALESPAVLQGNFSVGDVFSRSFSVFGRHFLLFSIVTAIVTSPNLYFKIRLAAAAAHAVASPGQLSGGLGADYWGAFVGSMLVTVVLAGISQGAILSLANEDLQGRPVALRPAITHVFARLLPLLGTLLCVSLLAGVASLLLIIPGFIVWMMGYVALPVCVIEKQGPMASFSRSADLTKGHRWQIFGIALVLGLAGGIGTGILAFVAAMTVGPLMVSVVDFPLLAIFGAFGSVLSTVIYHDLRVARDGHFTDHIAAVFD